MGTGLGLPGVPGAGSEGREQRSDPRSPTNLQRTGQLSLGSSRPRQCRPHVPQNWRDLLNSEKHQDNPTRCSWKGPRDDTSNHGPNAVGSREQRLQEERAGVGGQELSGTAGWATSLGKPQGSSCSPPTRGPLRARTSSVGTQG